MSYSTQPKMWYWIVAIFFLLWNFMGLGAFLAELSDPSTVTASFTTEQLAMYNDRPWWYMPNFGMAVVCGTFACVLLLFKRKLALAFAVISLIAVSISTLYEVFMAGTWETMDAFAKAFTALIVIMDVLLVFFTRMAYRRAWIR